MSTFWYAALLFHAITLTVGFLIWRPLRRSPGPTPIETTLGIAMITTNGWFAWANLTQ